MYVNAIDINTNFYNLAADVHVYIIYMIKINGVCRAQSVEAKLLEIIQ